MTAGSADDRREVIASTRKSGHEMSMAARSNRLFDVRAAMTATDPTARANTHYKP